MLNYCSSLPIRQQLRNVRKHNSVDKLSVCTLQRGFTMVEVMVSVAIIAIVIAIGIPSLSTWVQNTQVRSTAESLLTGLQLARAEAVRQNIRTRFQLAKADGTSCAAMGCWIITTDSMTNQGTFPSTNQLQSAGSQESGTNARIGVNSATVAAINCCTTAISAGTGITTNPLPGLVFNAFGQVVTDASVSKITRIDVTSATLATARRMVITITSSGMAKLCDPSLPSSNSRGCT